MVHTSFRVAVRATRCVKGPGDDEVLEPDASGARGVVDSTATHHTAGIRAPRGFLQDGVSGLWLLVQVRIPATAARQCTRRVRASAPWTGGPIPVEDPVEMNTVLVRISFFKTVKVNKEVFRCFTSGEPTCSGYLRHRALHRDLRELLPALLYGREIGKAFEVAVLCEEGARSAS
jgi:hypothetical protein